MELREQSGVDPLVDGVRVPEIPDEDLLRLLPDSVDTADALLDLHRVPGEVVVDQHATELQIDALARHLGREQHRNLRVVAEAVDHVLLGFADAAMQELRLTAFLAEALSEVSQCALEEGEDDELLAGMSFQVLLHHAAEGVVLGVLVPQSLHVDIRQHVLNEVIDQGRNPRQADVVGAQVLIDERGQVREA